MRLTKEEFIEKARKIHGDKYDYSKTRYINTRTKIIIICPKHGEFLQRPDQHLANHGCPKCGHEREINVDDIAKRKNIFLQEAREIHGNKYNYSKVEYINTDTKVYIICPEHGEFWQTPYRHIHNKVGCPICKSKTRKCHKFLTKEEFIEKALQIHGNKYDYSKVDYVNKDTKVCIICPEHGEFWQTPYIHLRGCGCIHCGKRLTTEVFIKQVRERFGDNYTFEKTHYSDNTEKVILTCKKHGDFSVTPNKLFGSNRYCPQCRKEERLLKQTQTWLNECKEKHGDRYDYSLIGHIIKSNKIKLPIKCKKHNYIFYQDIKHHLQYNLCCPMCRKEYMQQNNTHDTITFIEKAREIHGDRYDYSKVDYVNNTTKVCIICPEHGEFWQRPSGHLRGCGCIHCGNEQTALHIRKTKEDFINDAIKVHGDKYDYSQVNYVDCKIKVRIICPVHGVFEQTPDSHLNGCGCPFCKQSRLERKIYLMCIENNINVERQKTFPWLRYKNPLRLDFFLPEYNIAIECQGEQHYKYCPFFHKQRSLDEVQNRDAVKRKLCEEHGIKLLYYARRKYADNIITNKKQLLKEIQKYDKD